MPFFVQQPCGADQILGLVAKESRGTNDGFKIGWWCLGQGCGRGEPCKETGRDHVHALVRTLCGKDGGAQKLEWIIANKLALRARVETFQSVENCADSVVLRGPGLASRLACGLGDRAHSWSGHADDLARAIANDHLWVCGLATNRL